MAILSKLLLVAAVTNLTLVALLAGTLILEPTAVTRFLYGLKMDERDNDLRLDELLFFIDHVQDSIISVFAFSFLIVLLLLVIVLITASGSKLANCLVLMYGLPLVLISIFLIIMAYHPNLLNHLFIYMDEENLVIGQWACTSIRAIVETLPSECDGCFEGDLRGEEAVSCLKNASKQMKSSAFTKVILYLLLGSSAILSALGCAGFLEVDL